jgi:carboxylesterase type B
MREKDISEITKALSTLGNFVPIIDEQTVFSDYPKRSLSGNFINKPLLIGHNDFESGLFRILNVLRNVTLPDTALTAFDLKTFSCPAAVRADVSVLHGLPVWRYRYFGEFPNMQLSSTVHTGAYHGAEVNVLFDTAPVGGGIPESTVQEVELGKYMRGAWAAFARDPVNGLKGYQGGWPLFDPEKETVIRLGYGNNTVMNLAFPGEYDAVCGSIFPVV